MMQRPVCFALVAMVAGHFAMACYGQGGNLLNKAASSSQAAAQQRAQQRTQAQVQQRTQAQVQQRAQAQVQQRANAQVQQRTQTRLQQKIQGQLGSRVRGAAKNAASTARGMRQQQGNANRLGLSADANVRAQANVPGTAFAADSKVRVNGSGRLVVPGPAMRGNGEVNVEYFDNVFGRFNPFRQQERGTDNEAASNSQRPGQTGPSTAPSEGATQDDGPTNDSTPEKQRSITGIAVRQKGAVNAQVDLSKAVRLRRSEISAVRDHALATGNAQLMASADQMEQILDRYMQAQAAAEAQARATGRGVVNALGTQQGSVNASATGQARGRVGGNRTRVAQRPDDAPANESQQSSQAAPASQPASSD